MLGWTSWAHPELVKDSALANTTPIVPIRTLFFMIRLPDHKVASRVSLAYQSQDVIQP